MKKIIAMAVAIMMLVSVCVVGAVPAAAESVEKLIVNFDGVGPASVSGQSSSVGTVEGVGEGNVAILNMVQWQGVYIRLPENFGYGGPTHIKFWAKTNAGSTTLTTNASGFTDSTQGTPKVTVPSFNGTEFTTVWQEFSIALPEMTDLQASTCFYLTFKPEKLNDGVSQLYIDDISLVYADAADMPSDDWQAMFDWESGFGSEVQLVGNGKVKTFAEGSENTAADSENSLFVYRTAWNQSGYSANYVQINLDPEMMKNVDDLRVNYRSGKGENNKKPTMGVVVDGEVYWGGSAYFGGNLTSTTWAQQSVTAYTYGNFRADGESAEKPTITITKANLADVEALVFTTAQYNDGTEGHYANSFIIVDDIEYIAKASTPSEGPTASFEGTETPVESIDGTSIVMPEGSIAGKLFAGWSDGENLYAAGSTVEIAEDTTFTAVGVAAATQDGAAVRLLTPTGLRFETQINKADYDAIAALGATVKTGTLILPKDYLTGDIVLTKESLDENEKIYLDIQNSGWYNADTAETDGYYQYFATIANIKEKNYDRTFVSAGYLEISYADGSDAVLLYCGDGSNTERTVSDVAQAALDDPEGNYTDEEKAILQGYVTTNE